PAPERIAGRNVNRGDARCRRGAGSGRLRLLHVRRQGGVPRHSGRGSLGNPAFAQAVRLRRAGRTGAVPLSGARVPPGPGRAMTERVAELLRALGARIINGWIWRLGFALRFLWLTLLESGPSFRRFHLTIREIYFAGVLSLVIILVSGLFVGMVLGLQGYDTLVRYGSSDALRVLLPLSLGRELGPVVAGLVFAGRAGRAAPPEVRPMKAAQHL